MTRTRTRTILAACAAGLGLAAGAASAQTTATGKSVAGAPIGTTGTPRAGTGIPSREEGGGAGAARTAATQERGIAAPAQVGRAAAVAPAGAKGPINDNLFAAAAAGSGLCEVATSRLAAERGGSDEVRLFAQRMIGDHTKANQELMALAGQKGIALPNTLPVSAQAELDSLGGLSGEDFDKCYIHNQLAGHIQAVGLFEAESERGQDTAMKSWAAKTLPTLKEHKMMVKRMHEACEAKEKSASSTTAH